MHFGMDKHKNVAHDLEIESRKVVVEIPDAREARRRVVDHPAYRGTSPMRKRPPPSDPPRALGIGLRWGPRGVRFLVSEVLPEDVGFYAI